MNNHRIMLLCCALATAVFAGGKDTLKLFSQFGSTAISVPVSSVKKITLEVTSINVDTGEVIYRPFGSYSPYTMVFVSASSAVKKMELRPNERGVSIRAESLHGSGVRLHLTLRKAVHAQVDVCDIRGRLVQRLLSARIGAGRHVIDWDGRGENCGMVAPMVYQIVGRIDGEAAIAELITTK